MIRPFLFNVVLTDSRMSEDEEYSEDIVSQFLLEVRTEVADASHATAEPRDRPQFACLLCPFRTFDRRDRLQRHISKYHTADRLFVPNSRTKAPWHVALALFEQDKARNLFFFTGQSANQVVSKIIFTNMA